MSKLMRCFYCGLLQDEPKGVKECQRCGGELGYEAASGSTEGSYLLAQLELDQVQAPAGRNVDRYLLATLTTPDDIPESQSIKTTAGHPPLNFSIVLDVSGSMQGQKIEYAKRAIQQSLHHLQEGDTISLVTFSNDVRCIVKPVVLNAQVRKQVESLLDEILASGMTALDGGLEMGILKALEHKQANNLVLLLSDGQANVGEVDLEKIGVRAAHGRKNGLVISSIGVGLDYNEALMAEIANQGGGRFYHLVDAQQIPVYMTGELGEAANIAARQTVLNLNLPPGCALIPLSSAYPAEQTENVVRVMVGDIPAGIELEIPLRLTVFAQNEGTRLSVDGKVDYTSPAENRLVSTLNRVTLRFTTPTGFELRQGVAAPVVEKVIRHRQAAYVMGVSRTANRSMEDAQKQSIEESQSLREYASLLGEVDQEKMVRDLEADINFLAASPASSKMRIADAQSIIRGSRKFGK